jgi:hypothetical protein
VSKLSPGLDDEEVKPRGLGELLRGGTKLLFGNTAPGKVFLPDEITTRGQSVSPSEASSRVFSNDPWFKEGLRTLLRARALRRPISEE